MDQGDDPHHCKSKCCVVGEDRDRAFLIYDSGYDLENDEVEEDVERCVRKLLSSNDPKLMNIKIVLIAKYKRNVSNGSNFEVEVYSKDEPDSVIKAREIYDQMVKNMNGQFEAQKENVSIGKCDGNSCVRIGRIAYRNKVLIYETSDPETCENLTKECIFRVYSKDYPDAGEIKEMRKYL